MTKPTGRPSGMPPFVPTAEHRGLVEMLGACGVPQEEMRFFIVKPNGKPISDRTLRKYFKTELHLGLMKANTKVGGALFKNATTPTDTAPGGNVTAQIFWLKTRAKWKETIGVDHTFLTEAMIKAIDLGSLSDDDLAAIRAGEISNDLFNRLAASAKAAGAAETEGSG